MITTTRVVLTTRQITLKDEHQFRVKYRHRTYVITLIEVRGTYFMLWGYHYWRGNPQGLTELQHGYGSTDQVAAMPFEVAQEVRRCLEQPEPHQTTVPETIASDRLR